MTQAQYRQMISDLMDFLSGHSEAIVTRIQQEMEKAAEELRFEKAAALRDQLKAIQSIIERQKVVFASDYKDSDVLAMARADGEACVQIFFIRGGKLIGREYFILEGTEDAADTEVMAQFVKQFYTEAANIPAAGDAAAGDRGSPRSSVSGCAPSAAARRWRSSSHSRASRTNWSRWLPRTPPRPCRPCAPSGRLIRTNRNRRWPNCNQALAAARAAQPDRVLRYFQYAGRGHRGRHGGLHAGRA